MSTDLPNPPETEPDGPRIGVDEWVARHGERAGLRGGPLAPLVARAETLPWWALLAGAVAVSALVPFISSSDYVIRVAVNTVLFALLAVGLNVVVGWAGLLDLGFIAGLKGFTAAVVGGIGSIPGAMRGGMLIGLAEAFITGYVSSTFQDVFVFSILIALLLIRPSGLLGKADIQKV